MPIQRPTSIAPGTEHFLHLSFRLRSATLWADAGFEVARQQLPVNFTSPPVQPVPVTGVPTVTLAEENGNKTDVRWAALTDSTGRGRTTGWSPNTVARPRTSTASPPPPGRP